MVRQFFITIVLLSFNFYLTGQTSKTRILFLFDGSQSMFGRWEGRQKIKTATELLIDVVDSLEKIPNVELALRLYGHQHPVTSYGRDCKDTKLEVPFGKNNATKIKEKLINLVPKGTTPIAYSLEQAGNDFPPCDGCQNVIILITDGIEECDGDPCAIAKVLAEKKISLRPFVIGIGLDEELSKSFHCVGPFYNARYPGDFKQFMGIIISQILNKTTCQVNLLDIHGRATETNVNMTFYDQKSGEILYNFYHTMNDRGVPDTINISPSIMYKIQVHTLPDVWKDSVQLTAGIHNIIAIDAPQGYLQFKTKGFNEYPHLQAIIRKAGSSKTLYVQEVEKIQKYLVGSYDLEILTTPRIYLKDVKVSQNHTTIIEIPAPGVLLVNQKTRSLLSVYHEKEDGRLEWLMNLNENYLRQNVVLQPGRYRVVQRPVQAKETEETVEKIITIAPGLTTSIQF